ncbi:MAG: Mur ligase family protein [candidate division WOR-3 bacterium]|nr:Mur ligase family protein [candidate division WOR-3 bacterium]MDW7987522.1 Mur ligase family protein [candidate division WOR-3 bacterium]
MNLDKFLYSLINYEQKPSVYYDFKLNKFKKFLAVLNYPNKLLNKPIIIAGTKGKGSTAHFIASALISAGFKVGLYTSPHILSWRERIKINNKPISYFSADKILNKIKTHIIKYQLTFFETLTTLAYLYFLENEVDFTILEVGIGGRLDATNTSNPIVAVITKIGFDHIEILGPTLTKITYEKAGVIRKKSFIVCAPQRPIVYRTLKRYLESRNIPYNQLYYVPNHLKTCDIKYSLQGTRFVLQDQDDDRRYYISTDLIGRHQIENILNAYGVLKHLKNKNYLGESEFHRAVTFGFSQAKINCRVEVINTDPLIIIDVAHNPESIMALVSVVNEIIKSKAIIVFASLMGKLVREMFLILKPIVKKLILTEAPNPRTIRCSELMQIAQKLDISAVEVKNYQEAFDFALKEAKKALKTPIIVCGSFYLAGAVYEYVRKSTSKLGISDKI